MVNYFTKQGGTVPVRKIDADAVEKTLFGQ